MAGEPMTTDNENIFDGFEIDEIFGFVLDQTGPEGLHELLDTLIAGRQVDRETLLEAAQRLCDAGLKGGADIILNAADSIEDGAPTLIAKICADPNKANVKACLAYAYRRDQIKLEHLLSADLDPDILEFVCRSSGPLAIKQLRQMGMSHLIPSKR
jgi:hypothetical protein